MIDKNRLAELLSAQGLSAGERELEQFDIYAQFLVCYNQNVNLTAITEPEEIVVKHFLDSALLLKAVEPSQGASLVDVGTGAGFPAVPVKILRPDLDITLMDSLGKRITFLSLLSEKLGQDNRCVHARAEEAGRSEHRERYDYATARAVADLRLLAEYCLPLVKPGGRFIALKGGEPQEEIAQARSAIKLLGGEVKSVLGFTLPDESRRSIIVIEKTAPTPEKYPRHGGRIAKSPL